MKRFRVTFRHADRKGASSRVLSASVDVRDGQSAARDALLQTAAVLLWGRRSRPVVEAGDADPGVVMVSIITTSGETHRIGPFRVTIEDVKS